MSTSINIGPCDCCGGGCCSGCPGDFGGQAGLGGHLHVTIVNVSGAACLDGVSVRVTYNTSPGCVWQTDFADWVISGCCGCSTTPPGQILILAGVRCSAGVLTASVSVFQGAAPSTCFVNGTGTPSGTPDCSTPSFTTDTITLAGTFVFCGPACDPSCLVGAQVKLVVSL